MLQIQSVAIYTINLTNGASLEGLLTTYDFHPVASSLFLVHTEELLNSSCRWQRLSSSICPASNTGYHLLYKQKREKGCPCALTDGCLASWSDMPCKHSTLFCHLCYGKSLPPASRQHWHPWGPGGYLQLLWLDLPQPLCQGSLKCRAEDSGQIESSVFAKQEQRRQTWICQITPAKGTWSPSEGSHCPCCSWLKNRCSSLLYFCYSEMADKDVLQVKKKKSNNR